MRLLPAAARRARRVRDLRRALVRHPLLLQRLVLLLVLHVGTFGGHPSLLWSFSAPLVFPCSERTNQPRSALRSGTWGRGGTRGNRSAGRQPGSSLRRIPIAIRCSALPGSSPRRASVRTSRLSSRSRI